MSFKLLLWSITTENESAMATNQQPVQGSFLKLLPPQLEVPEKPMSANGKHS